MEVRHRADIDQVVGPNHRVVETPVSDTAVNGNESWIDFGK